MKRILSLLIIFMLILSISPNVFAIGEITGTVRHTDIKAYVRGKPIKSYNVDNWTCIVAEDLRDYNFEVIWSPNERELHVIAVAWSDHPSLGIPARYEFEENTHPVGAFASYVYATDIKTYVNGKQVTAFNIGGQTLIYIDDLMCFGDVVWNAEKREISFTRSYPYSINLSNGKLNSIYHNDKAPGEPISNISVEYKNSDGKKEIIGENLEHLSLIDFSYAKETGGTKLGISLNANHLLTDEEFYNLCEQVSTIRYNGEILQENADLANTHAKVYVNDTPVKITDVSQGKGNNHKEYYFHLDTVIPEDEIKSIKFTFGK